MFKKLILLAFMVFGFGLVSLTTGCTNVGNGEVGVKFDPMGGGVKTSMYDEGFHIVAPWVNVIKFSTKTQVFTMSGADESNKDEAHAASVQTTTKEGLYVTLDLSVQYRIDGSMAWKIYQTIGNERDYQTKIILPQIRSTIRDVVSKYTAAEVYGEGKSIIELAIFTELVDKFAENHIYVDSVLLRSVVLPTQLTTAIEAKQTAEQQVLQMQYTLQKEEIEAQRKVVEAQGIADSNAIISGSLTQEYLNWYWIQTMNENPKAIYIPVGNDGLPLFQEVSQ